MSNSTLKIKKYNQEGDMAHEYNPLRNIILNDNSIEDFRIENFGIDLNNPVNIECQPSYDGTINLIVNDDKNPPRIVNSRFTVLENSRYRIINRNQLQQTNLYNINKVDSQTRLFRNINKIPQIKLNSINYYGKLKGGNYTFYVKFADNDYNKTDIVCESGIVSVFKGTLYTIPSISGTLSDELTDKTVSLILKDIDTSFSKIYLYYTRETSDLNGARITETCMIKNPYEIRGTSLLITLNGYEEVEIIDPEEINIKYNLVTAVKTQAQVQNMLFFGNVQGLNVNIKDLQNISLYIKVGIKQTSKDDSIGYIDSIYNSQKNNDINQVEYYNPINIYYKLGYWPDEIYRLGIVYIMKDDSLSPVFNLRGHKFSELDEYNYNENSSYPVLFEKNAKGEDVMQYIPQDEFILEDKYLDNTKGVFKNPRGFIYNHDDKTTRPWYYEIQMDSKIQETLQKYDVKGYFIVRQKRIPTILTQGLSIGVDKISYTPMLYHQDYVIKDLVNHTEVKGNYINESFINDKGVLMSDYESRKIGVASKQSSGLLSLDTNVNPLLQSLFDGTQYVLEKSYDAKLIQSGSKRQYYIDSYTENKDYAIKSSNIIYVNSDIPLKYVNNMGFSTRAGSPEEVKNISFFGDRNYAKEVILKYNEISIGGIEIKTPVKGMNNKLVRGIYCPFLGLTNTIQDNCIYNIRIQNYSTVFEREYFSIRGNDNSAFYAISDRFPIQDINSITDTIPEQIHQIYRGDCYTNTVSIRMHRNFIDSDAPVNDIIVDPNTWKNNYKGYNETTAEDWLNINRADLNAVPIGTWVTFKCLSNYNLGLRSLDRTNTDEQALMGNPRSFYPFSSTSIAVPNKIEESWLLNGGYSTTVGHKRNIISPNVPYIKDLFDNRIMFSNVQIDDDFRNAYRVFQGLSFKDIDRQYGAIVKLIPWGVNLFCVFEHGLAILPINEKALIATSTGQPIHMYGAGVLQNQVTLISPDFGSIWQDSIIRTPMGIYGVDTYAKKIWRFSEEKGLELISDMKVQRFLNENIKLLEKDKYPTIALKNVKSHFNNYKGDVMFTFYNDDEGSIWHLCYNERMNTWVTQYSWVPLYSENINNVFYSLDKRRAEILAYIFDNQHTTVGINLGKNQNQWDNMNNDFVADIKIVGYDFYDRFEYKINWIESSYMDDGVEEFIVIPSDSATINNGELRITNNILQHEGNQLYYLKLNVSVTPIVVLEGKEVRGSTFSQYIGIVLNRTNLTSYQKIDYDIILRNGFFVHGRAGIFDEIDYTDNNPLNQIMPTKWYNKQEPFEFEFVVNNLTGFHKIFNNLVIISNNVAPKELSYEIIGDVYDFNKAGIYKHINFPKDNVPDDQEWKISINPKSTSQEFLNTEITYDHVLNQYNLVVKQPTFDIRKAGRIMGNLQYKEDAWYLEIEPIKYKKKYKATDGSIQIAPEPTEVRIRDKFLKVRVKYSGEDLAIITALKTFMTVSYS